jgi:hypothetical protein
MNFREMRSLQDAEPMFLELRSLLDESGVLGRHVPGPQFLIPRVELKGTDLVWEFGKNNRNVAGSKRSLEGALDDFIRLNVGSNDDVLAYARTWGVLGLCEHGLPFTQASPREVWRDFAFGGSRATTKQCVPRRREPLRIWRDFSRRFEKVVQGVARLREDPPKNSIELAARWEGWIGWVNYWLEMSGAGLICYSESDKLQDLPKSLTVGFEHYGLFDLLTAQLLIAVLRANPPAICAACGTFFIPQRAATRGTRRFCPKCREQGEDVRFAMRDYRANKKGTGKLGRK